MGKLIVLRYIMCLLICSLLNGFSLKAQEVLEYWENDSIKTKGNLVKGERDGIWREWYSNGKLKSEGKYSLGKLQGTWKYYCEHGVPERVVKWNDSKCYKIVTYFPFGQPYVHLDFQNGISAPQYLEYLKIFKWARLNQKRLLLENKEEVDRLHYQFVSYQLPRQYRFMFGMNEGLIDNYLDSLGIYEKLRNEYLIAFCKSLNQKFEFNIYYDEGKSERLVKNYGDGNFFEVTSSYYTYEPYDLYLQNVYFNDTLLYRMKNLSNSNIQFCKEYYSNGNLHSIEKFKKGKKDGTWEFYSLDEKLIRKEIYKGNTCKVKLYN